MIAFFFFFFFCVCVRVSVPIYLLIRSSGKKKRTVKSLSPEHCPFPETVYNFEQQQSSSRLQTTATIFLYLKKVEKYK